ncbi:hypothetical protein OUZ56_016216 [Daphnia magna]|uniref:Uncharacterized protein n=1 Tax=Daphnia magna TaxID=35525 RepID=A0ABR0APZ7_9CRUS|nr:hypothetical protein OUZ56_016216 [Daphnia magna]
MPYGLQQRHTENRNIPLIIALLNRMQNSYLNWKLPCGQEEQNMTLVRLYIPFNKYYHLMTATLPFYVWQHCDSKIASILSSSGCRTVQYIYFSEFSTSKILNTLSLIAEESTSDIVLILKYRSFIIPSQFCLKNFFVSESIR